MFIKSHNRLLFTKLWLLKNLKKTVHMQYTVHMRNTPFAKELEHINGFERCGRLVHLSLYF